MRARLTTIRNCLIINACHVVSRVVDVWLRDAWLVHLPTLWCPNTILITMPVCMIVSVYAHHIYSLSFLLICVQLVHPTACNVSHPPTTHVYNVRLGISDTLNSVYWHALVLWW